VPRRGWRVDPPVLSGQRYPRPHRSEQKLSCTPICKIRRKYGAREAVPWPHSLARAIRAGLGPGARRHQWHGYTKRGRQRRRGSGCRAGRQDSETRYASRGLTISGVGYGRVGGSLGAQCATQRVTRSQVASECSQHGRLLVQVRQGARRPGLRRRTARTPMSIARKGAPEPVQIGPRNRLCSTRTCSEPGTRVVPRTAGPPATCRPLQPKVPARSRNRGILHTNQWGLASDSPADSPCD